MSSEQKKAKPQNSKRRVQNAKLKAPIEKSKTAKVRKLKTAQHRSFRPSKRIKHPGPKLPGAFRLFGRALRLLRRHWKTLGGIILVYGFLQLVLVRGLGAGLNLQELKTTLQDSFGGQGGLLTGVTLFGVLLGSGGSGANPGTGLYQSLLVILVSLALVWALRQIQAGSRIRVKEAFYKGMYPLVPFVLVLLVISLQLVPAAIGSLIYGTVISGGIAVTAFEQVVWALLFFLLVLLSLYMVCSSIFALYIVTLPDMTPMKALRSARQLVLHRRWTVTRKVLFLPLALLVLAAALIIPLIIYLTPLAEPAFFVFSVTLLAVVHSYMYTLYRELL